MEQNTYNPGWWGSDDDLSWSAAREEVRRTIEASQAEWDAQEAALRFGFGAYRHYAAQAPWDEISGRLRGDWESLKPDHDWEEVQSVVQRGWEAARQKFAGNVS